MGNSILNLPWEVRVALGRARQNLRMLGVTTIVTSTFRTKSEQQFLFNMFLRGNTTFPVAPPGSSRHEFGLAVDLVAVPPSDLPQVVETMRAVGFRWAGPADSVHFDFVLPVGRLKGAVEARTALTRPSITPPQAPMPGKGRAARPVPFICCN